MKRCAFFKRFSGVMDVRAFLRVMDARTVLGLTALIPLSVLFSFSYAFLVSFIPSLFS